MLISCLHHVNSGPTARLTASIGAQPLVSHLHHARSAGSLVSHLHRVNSSTTAYVTPPPRALGPDHSSPALHHVNSSPTTRVPPPPCQFKPDRSSATPTASIRAQPLMSHLHHALSSPITRLPPYCVNSSATACVAPPPCPLEPDRLSESLLFDYFIRTCSYFVQK